MSSFYGGRPGNSFSIVATFGSVNAMVTQFKKGPNYVAVHYDEHVSISSSDSDNGNVYRRGYNYANSMGGAELVGNLLKGSSGGANAELIDIRIGYDGTTYTSAGNAVRQTERILRNGVGLYDFDRVVTKSVSTYNRAFIAYPIMNPNAEFNFIVSEKSTTDALIVRFASSATPYSASNVQGITTLPADSTGGTGSRTIDVDKRTDAKYIVFTSTDVNAAEMSFKVRLWTTDSVSGKILACVGMDGAAW